MDDKNIRYVISHIDKDSMRRMTRAYQGRNTHATKKDAQNYLNKFLEANTPERLIEVFGPQCAGTFEVSAVECYIPGHKCACKGTGLIPPATKKGSHQVYCPAHPCKDTGLNSKLTAQYNLKS